MHLRHLQELGLELVHERDDSTNNSNRDGDTGSLEMLHESRSFIQKTEQNIRLVGPSKYGLSPFTSSRSYDATQ
jgi:hypothetical protein